MKRVVVGLSGGVDSSVAAYLLKRQGYEVIGLFMKNWHDDSVIISKECTWIEDSVDAMMVAQSLDIPFQVIDLSKTYKERIVNYMFKEYGEGRTPNPDVLCNREIKFDVFLDIALSIGADYIATGHYCSKEILKTPQGRVIYRLISGVDLTKDQSYFLCQLKQTQLEKALFPLGKLTKKEVRFIANKQNLCTAKKKDSQGLCFIGKVRLPDFLKKQLAPKEGVIIEISSDHSSFRIQPPKFSNNIARLKYFSQKRKFQPSNGIEIGRHEGVHYFTIGQRRGLHIGGKPSPLFVIDTDIKKNILYVGQGKNHPGLYRKVIFIKNENLHWIREDMQLKPNDTLEVNIRIRYRQPLQQGSIHQVSNGLYVNFKNQQSAVTEGQFATWYNNNELIGSGVI